MIPSGLLQKFEQAGLRTPRMLTLAMSGVCNLLCSHCWVKAGEADSPADVPLATIKRILEEFVAMGGTGVRLTGGEPLCHRQWIDVLRMARTLGFSSIILQTNALLVGDEQVAVLRELDFCGLTIQVSLDGVTVQSHDLVRGEGAFAGALSGITRLVQGGLAGRVSIFFTEMRHNLHEIPELLACADRLGISSVSSGALVRCGRAGDEHSIAPPDAEQYLALLERYDRDAGFRELYKRIGTVAAVEWHTGDAVRQECCTFAENPYLTPAGRLYPCLLCHNDEYSVNGVFEKDLAAAFDEGIPLWSALLQISSRRSHEIPECRECPQRASCAGGCMGRAWGSCGNLMAVDERCGVRRAVSQRLC
jgi:radical SAM protein with 4Fe4S-binding SPASM domain